MSSEAVDAERLRLAFRSISRSMKARSEELRALDAACGDGDLGITVTKGFSAIEEKLDALRGEPPTRLLQSLGMTFSNAAASTFGAFFATAFMHAGKSVEGKDRVAVDDVPVMLETAAQGIAARGRSKVGDRSILDALVPAAEAARKAVASGTNWNGVLSAAATGAKEGAERTRDLVPKVGRARWLGDKVKGTQDAGATFVHFFLNACYDALPTDPGRG